MRRFAPFLAILLVTSCSLPQWRVGQQKVPAGERKEITEGDRQAADLLARKVESPAPLKPVAEALSASLGAPKKPIDTGTMDGDAKAAMAVLRADNLALRKRLEKQAAWLDQYRGTELEGTGFNVFAPITGLGILGFIALFILFPGLLSVVFFVIRHLRGAIQRIGEGVDQYEADHPNAGQALKKVYLNGTMDRRDKRIIDFEKKYMKKPKRNSKPLVHV